MTSTQIWLAVRVEQRPDVLAGEPCFVCTRLQVRTIGELATRGYDYSTIVEWYLEVSPEDVRHAERSVVDRPRC